MGEGSSCAPLTSTPECCAAAGQAWRQSAGPEQAEELQEDLAQLLRLGVDLLQEGEVVRLRGATMGIHCSAESWQRVNAVLEAAQWQSCIGDGAPLGSHQMDLILA